MGYIARIIAVLLLIRKIIGISEYGEIIQPDIKE